MASIEGGCHRIHAKAGDTIIMPSNWIHCVLTVGDSIALGSNFLSFGHMGLVIDSHVRNDDDADSVYPCLSGVLAALIYSHVMEQKNDGRGDVSSVWVWNFLKRLKTKFHQEMPIIKEVNQFEKCEK